jgi:hypothetical protein
MRGAGPGWAPLEDFLERRVICDHQVRVVSSMVLQRARVGELAVCVAVRWAQDGRGHRTHGKQGSSPTPSPP